MTAWKSKIDALIANEEAASYARHQAIEEEKSKEKDAKEQENERKHAEWMQNWGKQFMCHISGCLRIATKPKVTRHGGGWDDNYIPQEYEHWDSPGDMYICSRCHEWTCEEHIYHGICQECAEKM